MSWGVSPWVYPVWDSLGFLDLSDYFLPHFREVFKYYLLKYFLQDNIKCPNIRIIGIPEEEDKKKDREKILEEIIVENFPKMGKEIITQVQETQSPKQDKPKAKHPKIHINSINKVQTQRTNIKSSKGKTTNNTQGNSHKDNS